MRDVDHHDKTTDELVRELYTNHLPHIYERLGGLNVLKAIAGAVLLLVLGLYLK